MRATYIIAVFFLIAAFLWAVEIPLSSLAEIHHFSEPGANISAGELSLLRAGSGSTLALQRGLNADSLETRLRCARLLALRGDRSGDRLLIDTLRNHAAPDDTLGAMAETFLVGVWDQRDGPRAGMRDKLLRMRAKPTDAELITVLNDLLEKYPAWANGYVQRARIFQRNGEGAEAKRQSLMALAVEPEEFEAMVVLGQAYLLLEAPEQAAVCLQQALRQNPRLKNSLRDDIRETLKAIDTERARRRHERRKEEPVI
jgi:tetratricopeptide (TPR) repeat protein